MSRVPQCQKYAKKIVQFDKENISKTDTPAQKNKEREKKLRPLLKF